MVQQALFTEMTLLLHLTWTSVPLPETTNLLSEKTCCLLGF